MGEAMGEALGPRGVNSFSELALDRGPLISPHSFFGLTFKRMGCAGSSPIDGHSETPSARGESRSRSYRPANNAIYGGENESISSCLAGLYQVRIN